LITADRFLFDQMMNYWPPNSRRTIPPDYWLWKHEWDGHGHDYAHVMMNLPGNTYAGMRDITARNNALQLRFFNDTIRFYIRYPGLQRYTTDPRIPATNPPTFTTETSRAAFTRSLGIPLEHARFSCVNNLNIREAKICISITSTGIATKQCADQSFYQCSVANVYTLLNWGTKPPQARVFNLPPPAVRRSVEGSQESDEEAVKEEVETDDEDANEAAEAGSDRDDSWEWEEASNNAESGEVEGFSGSAESGEVEDRPNDL
jgi:hypothetical protein